MSHEQQHDRRASSSADYHQWFALSTQGRRKWSGNGKMGVEGFQPRKLAQIATIGYILSLPEVHVVWSILYAFLS